MMYSDLECPMRTTLNIDDEVLAAARELARQQNLPTGVVVSRLLRDALVGGTACGPREPDAGASRLAGFRPFPARDVPIDNERINRLRDDEGI